MIYPHPLLPASSSTPLAETSRAAWPTRSAMLGALFRAAACPRPGTAPIGFRRVLTHWCRCAVHLDTFRSWVGDAGNPALQEALERRPSIMTCIVHPYLHASWSEPRKLEVIAGHYALLQGNLEFLRAASSQAIEVIEVDDRLQLQIDAPGKFEHEGQLVINLVCEKVRLYSLAFTLGTTHGVRLAYVGALQGVNSPCALQTYRSLTHRMHGLRPRDLLVTVFRLFCRALGVRRILAVSDQDRVSGNRYFLSSSQVFSSYDVVWLENGGVATEGGFFELDTCILRRSSEDIPSRKRAQYRRRYAMVSELSKHIANSIAEFQREQHASAKPPPTSL